ncbi:hypothetical protein WA026_020815 [Henosepilachna vigintioctopunctata]|uniref:Reverse transcriptase n=1 Tax=Henosepilachna vigintioctopunctata TaxID=420089 RepID=A0AAW1TXG2_9CUCU
MKKIDNSKNELKALWKLVKTKGFTDSGNGIKEIQSEHGHSIQDPESIANEFKEYFFQIRKNLVDKIKRTEPLSCRKVTPKDSFFLTPVTEKEMEETLKSLKNKNSTGKDGIQVETIKAIHTIVIPLMTHLINHIFKRSAQIIQGIGSCTYL